MNLHENPELFKDAVLATAQQLKIPEIYVEKDYWVTVALHCIFHSELALETVFKGGTALAKCYQLIDRFSEDIDIVILNKDNVNATQLGKKLKEVYNVVTPVMPEVELQGITNKKGIIRKTAHSYPKAGFTGTYGQVREYIILESTWLGRPEPYTVKPVSSYIAEMMKATGQQQLIDAYKMQRFEVQVLSVERTFCEKIMSLVRFSFSEDPYGKLANKIRHLYDLHQMLQDESTRQFLKSNPFEEMLNIVGTDDIESFKNNNQWLINHPATAIVFGHLQETWQNIRHAYLGDFQSLLLGDHRPSEQDLLNSLSVISKRMEEIKWWVPIK